MKLKNILSLAVALAFSTMGTTLVAQSTTPPVVVDKDKDNVPAELKEIKALIKAFEAKRDAYLAEQKALLAKLKGATEEQREAIREQLQDNRQQFLAELHKFREEIREELREIKGLIHNAELQRLLNAANAAGAGGRHKGQ